ncbi:hypothetical protein AVEN_185431-1 [Araneus ventricosus]|uniref:Uncharacterized protein n=1 Tax=Araneus ventricosus TaxID=182803 RepID=A0A4Y2CJL9_ARAVE|nr:hypothetical protein AVEN_185431-1 [Araneus ventricosus]
MSSRGDYTRTVLGSQSSNSSVLIGFERVDRLGSLLECESLRNLSLELYPLCELVSCQTPSGFESAVAARISELLSVCVAILCKCCFSCYLRFVFSRIFGNKISSYQKLQTVFDVNHGISSFTYCLVEEHPAASISPIKSVDRRDIAQTHGQEILAIPAEERNMRLYANVLPIPIVMS